MTTNIELDGTQCMRCGRKFKINEEYFTIELKEEKFVSEFSIEPSNCDEFICICKECEDNLSEVIYTKWNEIKDSINKELFDSI